MSPLCRLRRLCGWLLLHLRRCDRFWRCGRWELLHHLRRWKRECISPVLLRKGGSLEHPCRWIACSGCWDPQRWWTILPVAGFMAGDGRFLLPLLLCQGDGRYLFNGIDTLGVPGVGSCGNTKAWSPLARWEADLARSWCLSPADGTKDDGGGAMEDGGCVL